MPEVTERTESRSETGGLETIPNSIHQDGPRLCPGRWMCWFAAPKGLFLGCVRVAISESVLAEWALRPRSGLDLGTQWVSDE